MSSPFDWDALERRARLLADVAGAARRYLELELADDPRVADEGTALHELAQALERLDADALARS